MENPAEIWKKAPLEVRRILQEIIFPFDIKANPGTEELEKVGMHNLSPLYSVIPQKNDSNEPSNSPLVPETGLEPARREAYAPKAYVYTNFTTRACWYYIKLLEIVQVAGLNLIFWNRRILGFDWDSLSRLNWGLWSWWR